MESYHVLLKGEMEEHSGPVHTLRLVIFIFIIPRPSKSSPSSLVRTIFCRPSYATLARSQSWWWVTWEVIMPWWAESQRHTVVVIFVCLSLCLSVCLSVFLSFCLSVLFCSVLFSAKATIYSNKSCNTTTARHSTTTKLARFICFKALLSSYSRICSPWRPLYSIFCVHGLLPLHGYTSCSLAALICYYYLLACMYSVKYGK